MENLELAIAQVKEELPGMTLLENEPLSQHCSFRIGGPARAIAVPSDVTSLSRVCCILKEHELAPLMLGNGTNILFPDEGLQDVLLISTEKLTKLLQRHEERIELKEREEAILKMIETNQHLTFQTELQGVQLQEVRKKLAEIGEITDEEALKLVVEDEELFKKYLYYTSAKYIQRLKEPKNQDLMEIVNCPDEEKKVKQFNTYIRQEENLKKFQRIFPIIATTSISAHKIGEPGTYFDMVIMDEASQGNIAMSLVPIIRGRSLMLVGDPQQLSPVILLNPVDNEKLKRIYGVTDEYDYIKNSIYKTYLACDAVSEEILLSHHYRCNKKIISFNNKKYYNNKLIINSPDKAVQVMADALKDLDREMVCIVNMDTKNRPINFNVVSIGSINESMVPMQNIFKLQLAGFRTDF